MTAAQRLRKRLNATGCYRLTGETSADWETNACALGLEEVQQALDDLLADLFPATASEEQLAVFEARLRPFPAEATVEERRALLADRAAPISGAAAPEEWVRLLASAGVSADLVPGTLDSEEEGLLLTGAATAGLTEEEIARELDQILPAHLPWGWGHALTWRGIESFPKSFLTIDRKYKTWEEFDAADLDTYKSWF